MVISLKIGSITLESAAALAPMAGVADRAFRELCVRFGAAYVVGEMVSAKGITMGDRKSAELLSLSEAERPAAIQLFGDEPSIMAEAAQKALCYRPQAIDINMGCPAPKVVRNGGGSSLMRRPETAQAVVAAIVRAVNIPVTVKIRAGWEANEKNAGFTKEEREKFAVIKEKGFVDSFRMLYPDTVTYSWWSYRFQARQRNAGWRLDYFMVSESLKDAVADAKIHTEILGSDHCPVELDLEV